MKAIIISHGSKGLEPLLCGEPEVMLTLFSAPLISYAADLLIRNGFDSITVLTELPSRAVEDYFSGFTFDSLALSVEDTESFFAAEKNFSEPFLIFNGSAVCDFELGKVADFHYRSNSDITAVRTKYKNRTSVDNTEYSSADKQKTFTDELPFFDGIYAHGDTGIYVVNPEMLNLLSKDGDFDFSPEAFSLLSREGYKISDFAAQGYFCNIDSPESLLRCQKDILDGKTGIALPSFEKGIFSQQPVESGSCRIIPPCYIGRNVTLGKGSQIGPYAVICDGSVTGENAKISYSVVMPSCSIGKNCEINGCTVCKNSTVKAGARLSAGSVAGCGCVIGSGSFVGRGVVIKPESSLPDGVRAAADMQYGGRRLQFGTFNSFSGQLGAEFDSVSVSVIAKALASCEIGRKTGVLIDGSPVSKAVKMSFLGAMTLQGAQAWDFGEGFYSQLEFYTKFCSLKSGVFISSCGSEIKITLCSENGLPLSKRDISELENRIKYGDFILCTPENVKEISDITGINMMYRREIIRQSDTELSELACTVKSSNEKIKMLMDDCLYRLGCRQGSATVFTVNHKGTLLTAFSADCGRLTHDRLAAICLNFEAQNGRDVSAPFNSPAVFDRIAAKHGRRIYRYYEMPTDYSDCAARELSRSSPFLRDALFMTVKILNIMAVTGKSLKRLSNELPAFYVTRKSVETSLEPEAIADRLKNCSPVFTREGIVLNSSSGRVLMTPARTGKSLRLLAEADSYESSKELCCDILRQLRTE